MFRIFVIISSVIKITPSMKIIRPNMILLWKAFLLLIKYKKWDEHDPTIFYRIFLLLIKRPYKNLKTMFDPTRI